MPFVLLVEDDPALGAGLEECFRREHFDVHLERDGAEGLAAARDRAPDCIVLDVMLPGMNGFDLVRTFRAAGGAAPVLFLTARAEEADRVLGLEMGGDDYLVKPFSNRELIARVRALLRRARRPEEPAGQIACAGFVLEPEAGVLTLPAGGWWNWPATRRRSFGGCSPRPARSCPAAGCSTRSGAGEARRRRGSSISTSATSGARSSLTRRGRRTSSPPTAAATAGPAADGAEMRAGSRRQARRADPPPLPPGDGHDDLARRGCLDIVWQAR